jgi:hypothetical protein
MAGERRGQVVAQAHPLLVVVLHREHALVGAVLVGQELAERIGIFEHRRLDRVEAVALIDLALILATISSVARISAGERSSETARQARLQLLRFLLLLARTNADTAAVVAADDHAKGKGGRREPVTIVVAVAMALVAIAAMAVVIAALVVAVKTAPLVVVPVTEIAAMPVAVLNLDQTGRACNLDCRFLCNHRRRARWSKCCQAKRGRYDGFHQITKHSKLLMQDYKMALHDFNAVTG